MLTLGKGHRLPVGVEFTDFELGYSVIDGRTLEHIEQFDTETGLPVADTQNETFEEKFGKATNIAFESLSELLPGKIEIAGEFRGEKRLTYSPVSRVILDYIDNEIWSKKIGWSYTGGQPDVEDNNEMADDIRQETFEKATTNINIAIKLGQRKDQLRQFWGDNTEARFTWIIQFFGPLYEKAQDRSSATKEFAPRLVQGIVNKNGGKKLAQDEVKLIWSVLGLMAVGFDYKFPIITPAFGPDDTEAYKNMCSAIGQYIWWSTAMKQRQETASDGQEPVDIMAQDDESGPHYTNDYNDILKSIQDSSGEAEFRMCFNTFNYVDSEGTDRMLVYKQPVDYREYKSSLDTSIKVGNWMLELASKKVNFHEFRIKRPDHPTDGLMLLQYIAWLSGRRWSKKTVEIPVTNLVEGKEITEIQKVSCKKMADKQVVDYHEKRLIELFWSLYNNQKDAGIIKRAPKINMEELEQNL